MGLFLWKELFDNVKHFGVNNAIGAHKVFSENKVVASVKLGHHTSGFLNDNGTCGYIPGIESVFIEAFQSSASCPCHIERRAAQSAKSACASNELAEELDVFFLTAEIVVWKSGCKQ